MKLDRTTTESIYHAVYQGFERGNWPRGFDVCLWPDGSSRPMSSGYSSLAGGFAVLENVTASDFGDWSIEETTEDEFVNRCMETFEGFVLDDEYMNR